MRLDDIWINGLGAETGELLPTADAVAAGSYSLEAAESTGMVSYSRCREAPPELAVTAGREASKAAAAHGVEVGPETQLVHGHAGFQGIDNWSASCWIAGELLGERLETVPFSVGAWSNGALTGLMIGANLLTAQPPLGAVLVTTADRVRPPSDRFYASPGMIFGDGAAAAVLSRRPGGVRLISLVGETDTVLGGLARGNATFSDAPSPQPPDGRERTREFLASGRVSLRGVQQRATERIQSVVGRALDDAGLESRDIDWVAAPFIGRTLFRESFVRPLDLRPRGTTLELGLTLGHLSAADQLVGLHQLVTSGTAAPGDHVLAIGTGMGFTYAAAVLRVDSPV